MAKNDENGWSLSIRDGGNRFLNKEPNENWEKYHDPKELEIIKQRIIARHQRLGYDENLKKELYPTLFTD